VNGVKILVKVEYLYYVIGFNGLCNTFCYLW